MPSLVLLVLAIALFMGLSPMPANFLNHLIWKSSTSTPTVTGNIVNKGAYIRYVAYGQGVPILLLHGGLSNKLSWFSQIPWLVESGRRVVIDTRGHGESTPGHSALTYQVFAEDALLVLEQLGIQHTDIICWSDGGIIALLLGLEAPQRVGKIVAISANFHPSGLFSEADNKPNHLQSIPHQKILTWVRSWWSGAGERFTTLEAEIKGLWQIERWPLIFGQ